MPTVGRTRAESAAPIAGGRFAGLTLEHLTSLRLKMRFGRTSAAAGMLSLRCALGALSAAPVIRTLRLTLCGGGKARRVHSIARWRAGMAQKLAAAPEPMEVCW